MQSRWEYADVHLSAEALRKPEEKLPLHELASRLSNAIIETVSAQKALRWELVKMDFDSGNVTIQFRRLVSTKP